MYSDNKYQHVCTSEISYLTYFKNKKIKKQMGKNKRGGRIRQESYKPMMQENSRT